MVASDQHFHSHYYQLLDFWCLMTIMAGTGGHCHFHATSLCWDGDGNRHGVCDVGLLVWWAYHCQQSCQEVPPTVSTSKYYVFDDNGWLMPPLLLVLLVLLSSMHSHSWHHFSFSLLFDGNHGWVVIGDTFKHAHLLCLVLSSSLRWWWHIRSF